MERFWNLRRTHKRAWYGAWALVAVAVLVTGQWELSGGNPLLTQVLSAQAKKPDTTPPTVSVAFPASDSQSSVAAWNTGCSPIGVCGSASDSTGVAKVEVSAVRADGRYWDGTVTGGFTETSAVWVQASGTTSWKVRWDRPADGSYTLFVRATDTAAPVANTSVPESVPFVVDTVAPAPPAVPSGPEDPTIDTSATFVFSAEPGATFECQVDAGRAEACISPFTMKKLSVGDHSFRVVAIDAAGNRSLPSTPWSWTVLINKAFGISGDAFGQLYPGAAPTPLNLQISNPYNFALRIVSIDVSAAPAVACAVSNLTMQNMAAAHPTAIVVPANSTAWLADLRPSSATWPADWPTIAMNNGTGNQDACKSKTFTLSYTGTATKS